jgi:hypothetical protein
MPILPNDQGFLLDFEGDDDVMVDQADGRVPFHRSCLIRELVPDATVGNTLPAPPSSGRSLSFRATDPSLPDDLRSEGWSVAVHNDYMLNGVEHTFWLMTRRVHGVVIAAKGEGNTDAEALDSLRREAKDAVRLIENVVAFNGSLAKESACPECGIDEFILRYEPRRVREGLTVEVPMRRCMKCLTAWEDDDAEDVLERAVLEHDRSLLQQFRSAFTVHIKRWFRCSDHATAREAWLAFNEAIIEIEKQSLPPATVGSVKTDGIQA